MKNIAFLLLLIFAFRASAQSVEMLPFGTKITGYYVSSFALIQEERTFKVYKLDTIAGQPCKKIIGQSNGIQYFYQKGDSIFGSGHPLITPWNFLFKNNFTLGEQSNFGYPLSSAPFEVIDIDTLVFDSITIRRFEISFSASSSAYRYIYDKLGTESGFHGWCGGGCDQAAFWLCDFESPTIPYTKLPNNVCDIIPTQEPSNIKTPRFTLAPNPAITSIDIGFKHQMADHQVVVYDILGKIRISKTLTTNPYSLDITQLNRGVFWVKIGNQVEKLIKE